MMTLTELETVVLEVPINKGDILNKLLTPKDVQFILNIGKNTTYKLFSLKGFPKIRIGKKYFVYEDDLEKYLKDHIKSTIYV